MVQLSEQYLHTPWQQKVFSKLIGLQYKLVYHKGAENGVADALSRCPSSQLSALSVCQPQWLDRIIQSYASDPHAQELLTKLALKADAALPYTLRDGLIRYKNRV